MPVSALPLKSSDAVHRIKLLAGTRWSPGKPGKEENEYSPNDGFNAGAQDIGKEGWIKLASRKFDDGRMNRKFVSDVLERLVEAANVSLQSSKLLPRIILVFPCILRLILMSEYRTPSLPCRRKYL